MADGAYRWLGNAPEPDPGRVETLHAACDGDGAAAFGETTRAAVLDGLDRALAAARAGDLTGVAGSLARARSLIEALQPGTLEPRRGLAGLFDSRGRRLKRFREACHDAAPGLTEAASALADSVAAAGRRSAALETLWDQLRDAVGDLDAHLAAVTRRLTGHPPTDDDPAHPLEARKATLDACRAAALQSLPLIRAAQSADARASDALRLCGDGLTAWRDDWRDALGLAGKRPRRLRPEAERLARGRDQALARLDRTLAELKTLAARRTDLDGRLAAARTRL